MTIGATVGRELSITKICQRAYQLAGLLSPDQGIDSPNWPSRAGMARDFLTAIIDEIQTAGFLTRARTFENLTLTSGTYTYALSSSVWDVVGDAVYIAAGEDVAAASSETPVMQRDVETWHMIGTKSADSVPTLFFTDRSVFPVQVRLWPTPNEAGTIRFQVYRLLSDVSDGNSTPDLERYWMNFLIWELAHQLACAHSLPTEKCAYFATVSASKKQEAVKWSNQHAPTQIVIEHRTGWS